MTFKVRFQNKHGVDCAITITDNKNVSPSLSYNKYWGLAALADSMSYDNYCGLEALADSMYNVESNLFRMILTDVIQFTFNGDYI